MLTSLPVILTHRVWGVKIIDKLGCPWYHVWWRVMVFKVTVVHWRSARAFHYPSHAQTPLFSCLQIVPAGGFFLSIHILSKVWAFHILRRVRVGVYPSWGVDTLKSVDFVIINGIMLMDSVMGWRGVALVTFVWMWMMDILTFRLLGHLTAGGEEENRGYTPMTYVTSCKPKHPTSHMTYNITNVRSPNFHLWHVTLEHLTYNILLPSQLVYQIILATGNNRLWQLLFP